MAIAANFTADVTSGNRDLTVNFTDTSTGSPDHWLWQFGDGFTSDEQNPTHTYESSGIFNVTLRSFISSGTTIKPTNETNGLYKDSSPRSGDVAQERADFTAASFSADTSHRPGYILTRSDGAGGFLKFAKSATANVDLTSNTGIAILQVTFPNPDPGDLSESAFTLAGFIKRMSSPFATPVMLGDISASLGSVFSEQITDIDNYLSPLSDPAASPNSNGWLVTNIRVEIHSFGAGNEDTELKTGFITVTDPQALFSGTPRKGIDSIDTVFSNETAGTITAFSWKRRPSGISAPYVEFSTLEDPTETFDVTDPTP